MAKLEIWRAGGSNTGAAPDLVRAVEAEGWDGQMFMDLQSLSADPYAQMGAWAAWSDRLHLSPGVTNPITRNLAVTAASIVTIQAISGGRAVLGIGRGDLALAYLGLAPARLATFERALTSLQALLSGEEIAFEDSGERGGAGEGSVHGLSLGARPEGVRLQWFPPGLAKVPLDVAAHRAEGDPDGRADCRAGHLLDRRRGRARPMGARIGAPGAVRASLLRSASDRRLPPGRNQGDGGGDGDGPAARALPGDAGQRRRAQRRGRQTIELRRRSRRL